MTPRTRKLFGTMALLAFVIVYCLLAMGAAIVMQVNKAGPAAELVYFALAGLLWVPPAALIIWWMQRSPPAPVSEA